MRVGLTVSPQIRIERVFPHPEDLDDVMVMSVAPGWAGQPFMPEALPKVQKVRQELERRGLRADVEVDGGISTAIARRALDAGANVLVAASAIFQASDVAAAARALAELTNAEAQSERAQSERDKRGRGGG